MYRRSVQLSRVLADSKHDKDILRDVERCKADYLAMHPHTRTEEESEELARDAFAISPDDAIAPTQGIDRLQFKVYGARDTVETSQMLIAQIERCREASQLRCRAMSLLLPDSLAA